MKRFKRKDKRKKKIFSKLSLFQKPGIRSYKFCPLSAKGAPKIDYKNIKLLNRYLSENKKYFLQGLLQYHKKNKKNFQRQLKELEY